MEISYLGLSSFKIRSKKATLVTDPFSPDYVGIKYPDVEADIISISHDHPGHNYSKGVGGNPVVITGPGEYEIKGIKIIGIRTYHDSQKGVLRGNNVIYHYTIDGVSIVHCGDLGHKLDEKEIEILGEIHILMLPVGGVTTVSPVVASEIVTQLEPVIIIPMHYKTTGYRSEISANLADVSEFLKESGKENIIPQPKLIISKEKLPIEPMIVMLE